jgi:hypothetical protein
MATRPKTVTVWFRGIPYTLDLVRCRHALVQRQVEGELDSMQSLAVSCDLSRSTTSRFFSGRNTSLAATLKMLAALKLRFEEVARPDADPDEEDGAVGARPQAPAPHSGAGGAAWPVERPPA